MSYACRCFDEQGRMIGDECNANRVFHASILTGFHKKPQNALQFLAWRIRSKPRQLRRGGMALEARVR
jgi:hypothetical protein